MSKIPLPSFSTGLSADDDGDNSNDGGNERKKIPINDQWLIRVEGALQIYFLQRKKTVITYEKFSELVPKLELPLEKKKSDSPWIDRSERLWHDLLCVTVPRLYTVSEDRLRTKTEDATGKQNRPQELRRLLQEAHDTGVSKELSNEITQFLKSLQGKPKSQEDHAKIRNNSHEEVSQEQPEKTQITSFQQIEARVRDKAQQRLRHLERAELKAKTVSQQDNRVAVSDALFAHARHMLRQRNKGQGNRFRAAASTGSQPSANTKQQPTLCRVPFDNLVKAIQGYTRQELSDILQQIKGVCPGFVSFNEKNGAFIEKTTSIAIETSNFKVTRAKLTGEKADNTKSPFRMQNGTAGGPERTPPQPTSSVPVVSVSGGTKRSQSGESGQGSVGNNANSKRSRKS